MSDFEHIHSHRNLIGFDEHGVPTVTLQASQQHYDAYDSAPSEVLSEKGEQERQTFVQDYMNAVAAYRKTFPDTDEVLEKTPDPAVREMILRQKQLGVDTTFDRFDKQQPQCSFGLAGVCCRICHMGPCHISKKAEKGVCGADADLIVARNLLRAAAAGAAQHGMHGRELMLELKWAAEGKLKIPLLGKQKIRATAAAFGIPTEDRSIEEVAEEVASQLLSDLSNPDPEQEYRTLRCLAPPERVKIWEQLNLIPVSAYHEVFEAYHKSAVGTDGDWRSVMQQMLPLLQLKEELDAHNRGIRIELVKYGSWPELMDALSSGRVDAASVLVELGIQAYQKGAHLQLAALGHHDGNIIVGAKDIHSASDLKGRKVAIPSPQSSHNILMREYLEKSGVDASSVTFIELAPTEMPYALQSGEVDAYCVAEPFGSQAVENGLGRILATSEQIWKDSLCCGLVWNTDWSETHETTARRFQKAYLKAGDDLNEESELKLSEQYLKGTEAVLKASLKWISYQNLTVTRETYRDLTKKIKKYNLDKTPPSYGKFVYKSGGQ